MPPNEPRRSTLIPVPGGGDLGLVDALAQLTFTVHGVLSRIAADHELSIVQARLLGILSDHSPTITELARYLQLDKSSVTGLVDRAEERGLVARRPADHDRRSVRVAITPAGLALVEQAHAAFEVEISGLVGDLDATDQRRLSSLASLVVVADARRRGIDLTGWTR